MLELLKVARIVRKQLPNGCTIRDAVMVAADNLRQLNHEFNENKEN